MKRLIGTALLTALGLTLVGLAQGDNTLTVGLDADPPNLDPAVSSAFVDRQVQNQIYDKLVDIDTKLKVVPMLATKWQVGAGGLAYTFTLRQGVKFHDGTAFDASAVKFNLERYQTLDGSRRKGELAAIKEIKVLADDKIELDLKYPYAPLLYILSDRSGMMVSPKAAQQFGKDFTNNPVGTGPFKFVERKRQDRITLEKNPNYWGAGQPKFDKLIYRPFPDDDVRTANLLSGAAQIITPVAPKDLKTISDNAKTKLELFAGLGFQGIWLNTTKAPFNNKALRQAFAATIDRAAIDKVVFLGSVEPAATVFPPNSPAFDPQFKVPGQDLELAKKKLAEAGKPGGFGFTMMISAGSPVLTQLAQLYQAFAASAGISMKIEQVEFGTLLDRADKKNYDAVALGWSGRPDPDGNIFDFFTTGAANNNGGYSNPKVDKLLLQARQVRDMGIRKSIYSDALKVIVDDAAYPITYFDKVKIGTLKGISGLPLVPDGILRLKAVELK